MIYILDSNEKVVGILTNNGSPNSCPYYDDLLKESLDVGASTYEFYVPIYHDVVDLIKEGGYIIRPDLDNNLKMFQIMQVQETHSNDSKKYVYAEDAGLELLNDFIRPAKYDSKNAEQILNLVLFGTRWECGEVDYFPPENFDFTDYQNVLTTLQSIAKQISGELSFRVVVKNGKVTHRYVDFVEKRGTDTKKRFTYTKDIDSIVRSVDMTNVVTALIGVGSDETTFKSISATKSKEGYDKPANQDWVGDEEALQRYGKQGKHIFGKFEYETTDPKKLLVETWKQLQTQKEPQITYELDVALLERLAGIEHEKVRLGDTVYVIDETFSPALYLEARILDLDTCFSDSTKDKCTLGNFKLVKSNITAQMRSIQSKLLKKELTWDKVEDALDTAQTAQQNAANAQNAAESAQSTAQTANETAAIANLTATDAHETAQIANDTAQTAHQTATSAQQTAETAKETANDAINKLVKIKQQQDEVAQLTQDALDDLNEVKNDIVYKVEVISSNGTIFRNGNIGTTLTAKVYRGTTDITSTLPKTAFIWQKFNDDGKEDTVWEASHKGVGSVIKITEQDVYKRANFNCLIEIDDEPTT
ncbi:UNVERIFIED_ORG: phage minor structural protein [Heyndrickxia coagulans]